VKLIVVCETAACGSESEDVFIPAADDIDAVGAGENLASVE
jgi:hypothetical protein